ncbi:aldehyde dehydrogenase [Cobetia sp. 29-18-1]|uniref:aldehyde dehydrogenase n=1 Tax=Cobetia sp. 29-18-1 TaxID=3040018 RepID=UPI002448FEC6|nr:aldehyde dehydrogenase [Cobetia sp. 29-18-1]MDH2297689.1 aldehyde dehydrogenase [Cobetia sp. 29-18-1]
MPLTHAQWQQRASQLSFETRAYLDGEFTHAASGKTFPSLNPATGDTLAQVARCEAPEAERAVACARAAFDKGDWSRLAPAARKRTLLHLAELIAEHQQELALLDTLDMGKPITSALGDVASAIECLRYTAESLDKLYGQVAPTGEEALGLIVREPLGVVVSIVPWNFPLMMTIWKIAPALATGNSVILKPSEKSSLSALRLAQLIALTEIPKGVFQVLPGFGTDVGKALALSMQVDAIAFTGSTQVGKLLTQYAGQSNLKRTFLECGGKSPNIVFEDCADIPCVARQAAAAIFHNQGEVCIAGSRLLVHNRIREPFVRALCEAARSMQPGDPLDPQSFMGAIVDQEQYDKIASYIALGEQQGARREAIITDDNRQVEGCFIAPIIFTGVTADMAIANEEIFGPVLAVMGFDDEEEAIAIANDSDYGLAAGLWSQDVNRVIRVARRLQSGQVYINNWAGPDMTMPFGGVKQSGNGRDKSLQTLGEYTETKSIWLAIT